MNPISSTNFKFAIGNLPIKVSRDDDMLFSFRNQVVTSFPIKESESNQIPEYITSRHGEIEYLLTNLEDNVTNYWMYLKCEMDELDLDSDEDLIQQIVNNPEIEAKDDSSVEDFPNDTDECSLITLLDIEDNLSKEIHQINEISETDKITKNQSQKENLNSNPREYFYDYKIYEGIENLDQENLVNKSKSHDPNKSVSSNKLGDTSLNFKTVDQSKISMSNRTPKSRDK